VPLDEERFYKELVALRQGRALADLHVSKKLGSALRTLCGISAEDDDSAMAQKATTALTKLADSLPRDQRVAALVAFGLLEGFDQPFYGERVRAATALFDREEKTVKRRVDESLRKLARHAAEISAPQAATQSGAHPQARWWTESLCAMLSLEPPVPEAFERRTVIALIDGLTELDLAVSVPSDSTGSRGGRARGMTIDVFQGGTLAQKSMESRDRVGLVLRLPRALHTGERHQVSLRYRTELEYPHYACTPRYPCDAFDVSVRFGPRRPSGVYLLNAGFQEDARDSSPCGVEIPVDAAGEARASFRELLPGFTYGLRWRWPGER
jgi:hypothetical protein